MSESSPSVSGPSAAPLEVAVSAARTPSEFIFPELLSRSWSPEEEIWD